MFIVFIKARCFDEEFNVGSALQCGAPYVRCLLLGKNASTHLKLVLLQTHLKAVFPVPESVSDQSSTLSRLVASGTCPETLQPESS